MASTGYFKRIKARIQKIAYRLFLYRKRYIFLLCLFTLILLLLIYAESKLQIINVVTKKLSPVNECSNCNVLLVDIDILRGDALPCYGYFRNTAPNICAFASKSVVFKNNYSNSNWTLPSMFSTITSLYPTFHQVRYIYLDKLNSDVPTLAEVLQKRGYHTVFVTDSEFNPAILSPENGGLRGYDEKISSSSITQVINDLSGNSRPWFIHYYRQDLHLPYLIPEGVKPIEDLPVPQGFPLTQSDFNLSLNEYLKKHLSEVFTETALKEYPSILKSFAKINDKSLAILFYNLMGKNQEEYLKNAWIPLMKTYLESIDVKNESDVAYVRMMYDTNVSLLDNDFKDLFKLLDTERFADNTITMITSDHGEAFGEHGAFSHEDSIHTELFYVPLIIRAPGLKPRDVDYTTSNIDVFPTILELIGVELPSGLQGRSLIPLIFDQTENTYQFATAETYGGDIVMLNNDWLFHLPLNASGIEQSFLYNKTSDPNEEKNVSSQYPELTLTLYKQANLIRSYNKKYLETKKLPNYEQLKLSPEKVKRLQKEGYF